MEKFDTEALHDFKIRVIGATLNQMNDCYHEAMRDCGISEDRAEKIKLLSMKKLENRGTE